MSAGASPARQMYTHTLLNLTVLQRVNKQHKFLNFTEPLPTMSVLKCEQSRAEWFPLGGVLVEICLLPSLVICKQLILEDCAHPWEAQKDPHSVSAIP